MNAENRKSLQKAIDLLNEAKEIIEQIGEGEQEKFDNLSEGLQQTTRNQRMEEVASNLSDATSNIDDVIYEVERAME